MNTRKQLPKTISTVTEYKHITRNTSYTCTTRLYWFLKNSSSWSGKL